MMIEILEALPGRDYDRHRGYSAWLFIRFPIHAGKSHYLSLAVRGQMTEMARAAFAERYDEEPHFIQNIERSAWWRAGPVEEES